MGNSSVVSKLSYTQPFEGDPPPYVTYKSQWDYGRTRM
jgi:hypothetical protein